MDARVLVVGAGPVGLAMGCELLRHGVACRVVDKSLAPSPHSKALGVQARTLEVFDMMGIAERFVDLGKKVHGVNAYADGKRITHVSLDGIDSPYPFLLCLSQSETERVLAARFEELGGRVERGVALATLAQDDEGATATLARDGAGEERARFAWVVGCDGAHSCVRHALGLPFEGVKYDESFVLADTLVDWELPDDETHAFLSPDGVIVALPLPGARRWRFIADGGPAEPTLDDFRRIARDRGAPAGLRIEDGGWTTAFNIHRRIVPRYRVGRVFVAGDAAHIHSPVGGQGMNTGIQDAFNLAWKLALVDAGAARAELLDSYEPERRPIAAATLQSTDLATRAITLRNSIARELRNRLAPIVSSLEPVQRRMLGAASEVALHYRKSAVVGEQRTPLLRARVGSARDDESPTLGDWYDFGAAPAPGDRAPDVNIDAAMRLFDFFRSGRHVLLLFDGGAPTPEGYANLARIAAGVRERWGARVDVRIVVPAAIAPPELAGHDALLLDAQRALHARYGAGSECLYLIRPDGYVGFRAQPADGAALLESLARILV
jgi:2-polyprenyl-6-methoxyphenol hydroxylase-like FAD-dependent oxidoreductase